MKGVSIFIYKIDKSGRQAKFVHDGPFGTVPSWHALLVLSGSPTGHLPAPIVLLALLEAVSWLRYRRLPLG
ncbi:MAG: hypothetical protein Q9217_004320 [Psora testacea]